MSSRAVLPEVAAYCGAAEEATARMVKETGRRATEVQERACAGTTYEAAKLRRLDFPLTRTGRYSLSINQRDGKRGWKRISLPSRWRGELDFGHGRGAIPSMTNRATAQPLGLTLEQYSEAKALPAEFLRASCGLSDMIFAGQPAVRIPYFSAGGEELAVRFRIALNGDCFRWKTKSKPCLYGVNRIGHARAAGYVIVVESESDVHTLWHHGIPAVGLPAGANWREDRDVKCFDGIRTIYIVITGEQPAPEWLGQSTLRARAKVLRQRPGKDASAIHVSDPAGSKKAWQLALLGSVSWTALEAQERAEERMEAWESSAELARSENILAEFDRMLDSVGLVGERKVAKLIYLVVTSRLLARPVSIAVKGPSSGGKSFTVESVLRFFPYEAFYALTAMSNRALAYSTEPLKHRILVIYEAAGMGSDFTSYLIRSLLSEGRLRYETVNGSEPRLIERDGPTGLIITTTSLGLHPENETRLLSLTVSDTPEQTAGVMLALANGGFQPDLTRWKALQTWLATSICEVVIPYASALAQMVPPVAIRLRRDFGTILALIRAHALLHQASRRKDGDGRLIAEIADYAAVCELVADLVAEGAEVTIKREIRETVKAVAKLLAAGREQAMQADVQKVLKLDKSVISRRVGAALDAGVLRNLEDRRGRPARLVLGDPLPEEIELLPKPERLHGCAVAGGDSRSSSAETAYAGGRPGKDVTLSEHVPR